MATLAAPTMRSAPITLAQQAQPATTPVPVHVVVRWALYLLAFSLPFEMPNRQIVPVEVPTLTAALFLCTTGLQPRVAYGRLPAALVWFFACLYAYGLAAVVNGTDYGAEVIVLLLLLLQGILVFWAAANLLRNEGVARGTLVSLGLACA
ncbi:MAG TPA: hypothetical protein VE714_08635, partial [Gemmatimonadales bacterium]|nr:hypothetical protein [Gemmatimonadales bacterium]